MSESREEFNQEKIDKNKASPKIKIDHLISLSPTQITTAKKWIKYIIQAGCYFALALGVYFTLLIYYPLGGMHYIPAVVVSQVSGFLVFFYLLETMLLLKLTPRLKIKKNKLRRTSVVSEGPDIPRKNMLYSVILIFGLGLGILNVIPLCSTPVAIQNAELEFEDAYGEDWRDKIPSYIESYFMQSQFNLLNYFTGIPHKECNVETEIEYLNEGDDFYLACDIYYPKDTDRELPGHNSVIIKIHGGGWTEGDKGIGDMLWINKYLAAQGYIVCDIQYGLYDDGTTPTLPTPDHVRGDFTLSDMVFHIGYFTKQLAGQLAEDYDANLDSVFIMGGSAGGHLTGVVGLGYNDPFFAGNFSNALTIKGIIPLYPANDAELYFDNEQREDLIPGDPDSNPLAFKKFTPSKLADKDDPAALIFHGEKDTLVPISESEDIEDALEDEGVDCILLRFPFASHAGDFMVNNNDAQVWLYYLERFLYLEQ